MTTKSKVLIGVGALAIIGYAIGYSNAQKRGYSTSELGATIFGVPCKDKTEDKQTSK